MPYFGGTCQARVLSQLWKTSPWHTEGRQLVEALEAVASPSAVSPPVAADGTENAPAADAGAPPRDGLATLSFVRAAAWIVCRLAEAVQHAHQRGVLHRDIKPSNVLLGADGQPMVLDFNASRNFNSDQSQVAAVVGGTVAYMAPEYLRALATRDRALARLVDHRSDVYSLGMLLYEMVAGSRPPDKSGSYAPLVPLIQAMALERSRHVPSLRKARPDVPRGLESTCR
jgi:hypothetical protein